jgi:hypothetical protein
LQETLLGRQADFVCGHKSLGRDELFRAFEVIVENFDVLHNLLDSKYGIRLSVSASNVINGLRDLHLAREAEKPSNFLQSFYGTMSSVVTNPRDYIFSRLGMVTDSHIAVPNYTDSVEEIYTRFVLRHIIANKSLEIALFDTCPRQYRSLPSWVPDWSAHFCAMRIDDRPHVEMDRIGAYDVACNAHEFIDARGSLDLGKPLICSGYTCDVIDGVSATGESAWAGASDYRPGSQPVSFTSAYATQPDTYEALWRSLTCVCFQTWLDLTPPNVGKRLALAMLKVDNELDSIEQTDVENRNESRFQAYYRNIREFQICGIAIRDWARKEALGEPPVENWSLEKNMVDSIHFRRLITTRRGLIGLAPCESEPGDEIVMLLGSILLVVLRRYANQHYKVVGAAYIHGLMEGRGFELLESEGKQLQDFPLL